MVSSKYTEITPAVLTHWDLDICMCTKELGHHWFGQWFVTCTFPNYDIWTNSELLSSGSQQINDGRVLIKIGKFTSCTSFRSKHVIINQSQWQYWPQMAWCSFTFPNWVALFLINSFQLCARLHCLCRWFSTEDDDMVFYLRQISRDFSDSLILDRIL